MHAPISILKAHLNWYIGWVVAINILIVQYNVAAILVTQNLLELIWNILCVATQFIPAQGKLITFTINIVALFVIDDCTNPSNNHICPWGKAKLFTSSVKDWLCNQTFLCYTESSGSGRTLSRSITKKNVWNIPGIMFKIQELQHRDWHC